jgi:hypothetical protein
VKILLAGTAAALTAGVLLGGSMRPELAVGDRPAGPQMFASWSGTRSTGPFDPGTTFVAYPNPAPDYLLGTDWKKRMAWPDEPAATPEPTGDDAATEATDDAPPAQAASVLTPAAYEQPTPVEHNYPSLGGDAASPPASGHSALAAQPSEDDTTLPLSG